MRKNSSTRKTALVTGGAGFIGSHVVDLLVNRDWSVTVVDDLSANDFQRPEWTNQRASYIFEDFVSKNICNLIKQKEFDFIFHLAAKPSVPWSVENPFESHKTNVFKTLQLLETCKGNINRFIFSSSSAVYGNVSGQADEFFDEPTPLSPYALQKLEIEQYLELFKNLYDFDYVALRYFNVYGPRQLGGSPYSNVISSWLHNIKTNKPCRLDGDGSQKRDFIYVEDVASANLAGALASISREQDRVFNIGSGENKSCAEILKMLEAFDLKFETVQASVRVGDVKTTLANVNRANRVLGWPIKMHAIDEGIIKTLKWWKL